MKKLTIIRKRLSEYFLHNKTVFILFILGGMINAIMLSFFYGNILSFKKNEHSTENYYRTYTVNSPVSITKEQYLSVAESDLVENCMLGSVVPDSGLSVLGTLNDKLNVVIRCGTAGLGEGEIILPDNFSKNVGEEKEIFGKKLTVSAIHTFTDFAITSMKTFESLGVEPTVLRVYSVERQKASNDRMLALLEQTFPNSSISTPRTYDISERAMMPEQILIICFCFALSTVSFMFLLRFMMDAMLKHSVICLIVGAPKKTVGAMHFVEAMIFSMISNAFGLILHRLLYDPVFSKFNIDTITYSLADYAFILLIAFVVTAIVVLPFIRKFTRLSPIECKRELMS